MLYARCSPFVTEGELSEWFRISRRTLQRWREIGEGPVFVCPGRTPACISARGSSAVGGRTHVWQRGASEMARTLPRPAPKTLGAEKAPPEDAARAVSGRTEGAANPPARECLSRNNAIPSSRCTTSRSRVRAATSHLDGRKLHSCDIDGWPILFSPVWFASQQTGILATAIWESHARIRLSVGVTAHPRFDAVDHSVAWE